MEAKIMERKYDLQKILSLRCFEMLLYVSRTFPILRPCCIIYISV